MRSGTHQPGAVGFDFGTTNTSLALLGAEGQLRLSSFQAGNEISASFRSVLYFEQRGFPPPEPEERTHLRVPPPLSVIFTPTKKAAWFSRLSLTFQVAP